uniref:Fibrinogen C-terminal domain-containing protein n=1 Tax=Anopheles coluzzii TaxID=1518534 RepID=A0A8W7P831_ANOCL
MKVYSVILYFVVVMLFIVKVDGAEQNIPNSSFIDAEYQRIAARLDDLQKTLTEIKLAMNEDRAATERKLPDELNLLQHAIFDKLTTLQHQSNKMVFEQIANTTAEQIRKEIQKLASKEDLALFKVDPGLYFRSISTRSCKEEPSNRTGEFLIQPTQNDEPFLGYCEQTAFGGGWLVFQYRYDGSVDFYRNWTEYRNGFGSMDGEFWLGLEQLHRLTAARKHELLVELKDFDGNYIYARYDEFAIGSEKDQYPLAKLGSYTGTARDSLHTHKGMKFSTKDRDNDLEEPSKESGKYILQPTEKDEPFLGYCEQTAFGGGWLVFQYRYDGSVDFYRNWTEYRDGFGSMDGEFWLGLEQLHRLTAARKHELLVELKDFDGNYKYARYEEFKIGNEKDQYPLAKLGSYTGTAGDSLHAHKGMKFSTKDRDNDKTNIGNTTFSGFAFEMLITKLDYQQDQLIEVETAIKKDQEIIDQKLSGIIEIIKQLGQAIGQNLTALQTETNKANENQDQLRRELQKLTTKQDLDLFMINSGLNLRTVSFPSCKKNPSKRSGKYIIQPTEDDEPFVGYCEQTAFGGGWLVFQYRYDGSMNFYRNWTEYRNGFGSIDGEFWLGLDRLHRLTMTRKHELLVELKDFNGNYKYARYSEFMIGSEKEQYALAKLGFYTGTADDALKNNKEEKFTTMDRDNDAKFAENCASAHQGAWWYYRCSDSNLNGMYHAIFDKLTTLQHQSNKMITEQIASTTQEQIRKEIQKLASKEDLALFKVDPGLYFRSISTRSCKEESSNRTGEFLIQPTQNDEPFLGYCEQTAFGGGWLVFQYRYDGSVDFYRNWAEYRNGFGSMDGEFWLGLEHLHRMTSAQKHELLVELKHFNGSYMYARYDEFEIGNEKDQYPLARLGSYTGTAGDSISIHKGMKFSTKDRDNDKSDCAKLWKGAWWYKNCGYANLNGGFKNGNDKTSMHWYTNNFIGMAYTRMSIREK